MTETETTKILLEIAALWPTFQVTPAVTVRFWHEHLAGESFDDLRQALSQFAKSSKHPHPPSFSELYQLVRQIRVSRTVPRELLPRESGPLLSNAERIAQCKSLRNKFPFLFVSSDESNERKTDF